MKTGISELEEFGRWTDGHSASIEFVHPLPLKFVLKINVGVFVHLVNKTIPIIIGNTQHAIHFDDVEVKEVLIPVVTDGETKSIIFQIPDAKSPSELGGTKDTRKLGVALVSLQIEQT